MPVVNGIVLDFNAAGVVVFGVREAGSVILCAVSTFVVATVDVCILKNCFVVVLSIRLTYPVNFPSDIISFAVLVAAVAAVDNGVVVGVLEIGIVAFHAAGDITDIDARVGFISVLVSSLLSAISLVAGNWVFVDVIMRSDVIFGDISFVIVMVSDVLEFIVVIIFPP